jgi:hypothetical protein
MATVFITSQHQVSKAEEKGKWITDEENESLPTSFHVTDS